MKTIDLENHFITPTWQQALATKYGIRAIPTLLLINKGEVTEQMVGAKSKRDLKASLDRVAA